MKISWSNFIRRELELETEAKFGRTIAQIAHDIRSPLEVLKGLKEDLLLLPYDSRRRVQMCINRIEEITFNLLKTQKQTSGENQTKSEELLSLITSVITEKNIEYRNKSGIELIENFNSYSYGLFSKVQRSNLKSIISNLMNNGLESFNGKSGVIEVSLFIQDDKNVIKISDNGPGISLKIGPNLFTKGFTTKRTGNGLGLFNAKQEIEAVGGTIVFDSVPGEGTSFTITLPKSERPSSFIDTIAAFKYERIVILDDDPAFHEVWIKRLEGVESEIEHIYSVEEMFSKYQVLHPKILLLSDFELMDEEFDGIDTILRLQHAANSVLVTARSEEVAIQERCLKNGIKLLPKALVNYVKVVINPSTNVVLIDDDRLFHLNWASYCKKNGLSFFGFKSIEEFIVSAATIDKGSQIYIDSSLGEGIKGEVESERIFKLGFLNLYLSTGYEKDSIVKPKWIKEIYSKSPDNIDLMGNATIHVPKEFF